MKDGITTDQARGLLEAIRRETSRRRVVEAELDAARGRLAHIEREVVLLMVGGVISTGRAAEVLAVSPIAMRNLVANHGEYWAADVVLPEEDGDG